MSSFTPTNDHIANELLRAEVERLTRVVQQFEQAKARDENDRLEARLEQMRQAEQAEAARIEGERQRLAQVGLTRPDNLKQYSHLPLAAKVRLIEAFGASLPQRIAQREKVGLSWSDFDKMLAESQA